MPITNYFLILFLYCLELHTGLSDLKTGLSALKLVNPSSERNCYCFSVFVLNYKLVYLIKKLFNPIKKLVNLFSERSCYCFELQTGLLD
jgi:hypothetical protein